MILALYDAKASKQLDAAVLKTGIHEVLLMMRAASSIFNVVENLTKVNRVISIAGPCLLYTSPSPRDGLLSRMPSSA